MTLTLGTQQPLCDQAVVAYLSDLERLSRGEPIGYIEGSVDFLDWTFISDERALCPRPETEYLVSLILQETGAAPKRIIDLGCGSGVMGLSLAASFPNSEVWLTDLSADALDLARDNAHKLGLAARVTLRQGDWWDVCDRESFDLVVSNPPYVADGDAVEEGVRRFEPALALHGGDDGATPLRTLLAQLDDRLCASGTAYFECGHQHQVHLKNALESRFTGRFKWLKDPWQVPRYLRIQKADV